jgi:hypothetical protein
MEVNSASDIEESDKHFAYTANELFLANWKTFPYSPSTCSYAMRNKTMGLFHVPALKRTNEKRK